MTTLSFSSGPIPQGHLTQWQDSGRTLSHILSPGFGSEVGAFVTKRDGTLTSAKLKTPAHGERAIFFGKWDKVPQHLIPLYTRTYTLFHSLQQIAAESNPAPQDTSFLRRPSAAKPNLPSASQINFYSRIASLYTETLRQTLLLPTLTASEQDHWASITQIFHLAKILYLPEDGRGDGVVGEELLDWINMADLGPTTEEGEEILGFSNGDSWAHEEFWSYLIRSLLRGFLPSTSQLISTLSTHPSPVLSSISSKIATHLADYPRSSSSSYPTERAFLQAHSSWRAQFRTLCVPLTKRGWALEGAWGSSDESSGLEDVVQAVLELMQGKEDRVLEECVDWKEAVGAWGVWVRPSLKRDDLPETIRTISSGVLSLDPAAQDETVMYALLQGDITQTITSTNTLSVWLATHLTDLMDKLGLVETVVGAERGLRDHFVLEYALHLASEEGLWRMTCDYLKTCGEEGRRRVAGLLERISLEKDEQDGGGIDESKVEEVFRTLQTLGLEEESRTLSRVVGQRMVQSRQYGLAVAYCVRAGDGRRLGIISDKILNVYVQKGPKEFIEHVNSIPPSLFSPESPHYIASAASGLSPSTTSNPTFPILASKLNFLPLYRDFLESFHSNDLPKAASLLSNMFASDIAPKGFWAVLLVDSVVILEDQRMLVGTEEAYGLLGRLEEVVSGSSHSPGDYLGYLVDLQTTSSSTGNAPSSSSSSSSFDAFNTPLSTTSTFNTIAKSRPLVNGQRKKGNGKSPTDEFYLAGLKGLEVVRLALARYLARDLLG
ncbi:Nuclear pore complex component (sc Nup85) [Phaffia rhodozyma]|uniref:Nuclear pore complex protein Nup85 n=1 Tax=Phaffia rhodozyma TaxID=264483 RepID=A0A0F7SRQ7_PHARH|nr:Nuclear pore complex component (sc Nup85) [Phaffia rhodozyma]